MKNLILKGICIRKGLYFKILYFKYKNYNELVVEVGRVK